MQVTCSFIRFLFQIHLRSTALVLRFVAIILAIWMWSTQPSQRNWDMSNAKWTFVLFEWDFIDIVLKKIESHDAMLFIIMIEISLSVHTALLVIKCLSLTFQTLRIWEYHDFYYVKYIFENTYWKLWWYCSIHFMYLDEESSLGDWGYHALLTQYIWKTLKTLMILHHSLVYLDEERTLGDWGYHDFYDALYIWKN